MEINVMDEMILLERTYRKTDLFVSRRIAEEAVLVPLRQHKGDYDHIYSLNETAACAWSLLDGNRTLTSIVKQIVTDYEVEEAEAAQEVIGLVRELVTIGALEMV
jgi:hypothetical protein